MIHIAVDTTLYTTEGMRFPPWREDISTANTSRFDARNSDGCAVGFVYFTNDLKYLGSMIGSSLTSDADVNKQIKATASAFSALKNVLTNLPFDLRVKVWIYGALVLILFSTGVKLFACTKTSLTDCASLSIATYT
jgi:hypothetical protein